MQKKHGINMRERIPNELRQAVFERDNYTCQYCGNAGGDLEIEHIIPISEGGNNDMRNLATACRACNRAKGRRMLTRHELREIADKIHSSLEYLLSIASEAPDTENGEKKDKKLMMYFTPALFDEIRDWCYLKRISAVSYITSLIEADLHTPDKRDKIAFFRQLSNDA